MGITSRELLDFAPFVLFLLSKTQQSFVYITPFLSSLYRHQIPPPLECFGCEIV